MRLRTTKTFLAVSITTAALTVASAVPATAAPAAVLAAKVTSLNQVITNTPWP